MFDKLIKKIKDFFGKNNYDEIKKDEQICSECLCDLDENNKYFNCDHLFHTKCIKQWLLHKHTCPLCKSSQIHYDRKQDYNEILRELENYDRPRYIVGRRNPQIHNLQIYNNPHIYNSPYSPVYRAYNRGNMYDC